jgi:hypothetical protein
VAIAAATIAIVAVPIAPAGVPILLSMRGVLVLRVVPPSTGAGVETVESPL